MVVVRATATEAVNGLGPGTVADCSITCGEAAVAWLPVLFGCRSASAMPTPAAITTAPAAASSARRRRHHGWCGPPPLPDALTSVRGGGPAGGCADPTDVGSPAAPEDGGPGGPPGCGPGCGPDGGPGTCPEGGGLHGGPDGGPEGGPDGGGGPAAPDEPEDPDGSSGD
ncbi:hypothetical protein P3T37_000674 [Kitasatospora sp. MAA4]|uniref:hypothetical protein n=1 Tax=Kitasatospora sp. MAA4 TaxID=3035093 RepID=UPI002476A6F4|nr:hypothetical protein [Kitasatospora sp. MAA4]MDH6131305.1 hypothetical protein [Kitasatospora sp. MAA4]